MIIINILGKCSIISFQSGKKQMILGLNIELTDFEKIQVLKLSGVSC